MVGCPPEGLLLDLDGVIYVGDLPLAGAAEAVAELRRRGVPLLFVTNTSSAPRSALVQKLARLRIAADETDVWCPLVAAARHVREHGGGPVALFAPEAAAAELEGLELLPAGAESGARWVVIGDLRERWDHATLNRAFRLLHADPGCELVALGMTRYFETEGGPELDVGPYVAALEEATGRKAIVTGKPAAPFFTSAVAALGLDPETAVMVGDDARGDVAAAQGAGLRGLLVRTGKFRPADLNGDVVPDAVLDSIADLPRWWDEAR